MWWVGGRGGGGNDKTDHGVPAHLDPFAVSSDTTSMSRSPLQLCLQLHTHTGVIENNRVDSEQQIVRFLSLCVTAPVSLLRRPPHEDCASLSPPHSTGP